jgi:8-oxo-dGTP diphosphatase
MTGSGPKIREGASAILFSTDGRLLFQLRDNVPGISDPGKLGFFGGGREGDESFLDCVVREIHEEIGYFISPERFEFIGRYVGPDLWTPNSTLHAELFLAREVPIEGLTISEGKLKVVALHELERIHDSLAPPAEFALGIFLGRGGMSLVGDYHDGSALWSQTPRDEDSSAADESRRRTTIPSVSRPCTHKSGGVKHRG